MQSGDIYNHQTIVVDGETFADCQFAACRLVYSGGEPPEFEGCRFDACEWKFEGAAAQTLAFLKSMWRLNAKAAVQAMIKEITAAGG